MCARSEAALKTRERRTSSSGRDRPRQMENEEGILREIDQGKNLKVLLVAEACEQVHLWRADGSSLWAK